MKHFVKIRGLKIGFLRLVILYLMQCLSSYMHVIIILQYHPMVILRLESVGISQFTCIKI